ncbi:MAG TPA: metalloregulator ArsR/SmtB family transcription factor [candidate division Zixibacteria bacterium]|nr:metalloregulator ArsR/SmtB family transcription factor [candidate division Zixibacteria bacterium]
MSIPQSDELNLLHVHVCQALSDPTRLQILYALHDKPRNVTTIARLLDIPQSTISRHLAVLRQRSLVTSKRNGMAVTYSLTDVRIITVLDLMRDVLHDLLKQQSLVIS